MTHPSSDCAETEAFRQALGKELHAGLCQQLSAAALYLECVRMAHATGNHARVSELLPRLKTMMHGAVETAHGLSKRLSADASPEP